MQLDEQMDRQCVWAITLLKIDKTIFTDNQRAYLIKTRSNNPKLDIVNKNELNCFLTIEGKYVWSTTKDLNSDIFIKHSK